MAHDDCLKVRVVANKPCAKCQHADDQKEEVHGLVNVRTVRHFTPTGSLGDLENGICLTIRWTKKTDASEPAHRALDPTLLIRGKKKGGSQARHALPHPQVAIFSVEHVAAAA
jgi:hypothetical protein